MTSSNVSHELLDDLSGVQSGYTSKLLSPQPLKRLGAMSLPALLGALGVALVMVEDSAQVERVQGRWTPRKRPPRLEDRNRGVDPALQTNDNSDAPP